MRIDISKSGYHIDVKRKTNTNFEPLIKSGNSLINYKRILKESDSLQIRMPYIYNGFDSNNVLTDLKFNDNHTIDFDKNNIDLSHLLDNNEILNINELKASPSTFPTINPGFTSSNIELIEKYSKYSSPTSTKYKKFKDYEYVENNTINYDLINGENQYNFLDSNLFEQISIDIDLDNPNEVHLQNSAFIQSAEFSSATLDTLQPDDSIVSTYSFLQKNISNYDFRKTAKEYSRLNTPFVIYNFQNQCWEYRGIPNPYQYYSNEKNIDIYGNDFENPNFSKYLTKFDNTDLEKLHLSSQNFGNYFNKYFINELCLTNNPINYLPISDDTIDYTSNLSLPSSLFGFPHFEKFHMFNDNILKMSRYINKPMIIDKVTVSLDVDVQSDFNSNLEQIELRNGIAASLNFYILNQYKLPNISNFNLTQPTANNTVDLEFGFEKLIDIFTNSYTNFKHEVKKAMIDNPSRFTLFNFKDKPVNISNNDRNSYKMINRIINHQNLQYNNLINSDYVNDELIINDNIKYDYNSANGLDKLNTDLTSFYQKNKNFHNSYLREIVTFGNVVFYSQGNTASNNNNKQEIYTPSSIDLIKNNCDYFIDTDTFDPFPQYTLPESQMNYLDFSSNTNNLPIKFTTYLKTPSNIENILNNSVGLSSHNINRQFELYDNLNFFKFTEKSRNLNNQWHEFYTTNKLNRTISNASNIRSLNENSNLLSLNEIQTIKSKQLNQNGNNHINQVIENYSSDSSILNQSGSINIQKSSNFSPYIITPDNELGFVFSFSPTLTPNIFKQVMTLKKGKIKFTLHGHILKNKIITNEKTSTNINQRNIIGEIMPNNTFVSDVYNSLTLKKQNILNINDRIYTGTMCRYDNVTNFENFNLQNQIEKYEEYEYIKPYKILNQDNISINFVDYNLLLSLNPDTLNVINLTSYFSNQVENKNRVLNNTFKRIIWNISYNDITTNTFINNHHDAYEKISTEGFILLIDADAYENYIFEIKVGHDNFNNPATFRIKHQYTNNLFYNHKNVYISPYFKNLETYKFIGQKDFSFKRIIERKIKNDENSFSLLNSINNNYIYTGSKLLSNLSILPYINCIEKNKKYLYDDKITYEKIIKNILLKNNEITNFNYYKAYTIAKELSVYKNQKVEQEFIFNDILQLKDSDTIFTSDNSEYDNKTYQQIYQKEYDKLIDDGYFPIVAAILALLSFSIIISEDAIWDLSKIGDKRYLNQYYNIKKYGQFTDLVKQRLYTATTTDTNNIEYVIEQIFINEENGLEITDLQDTRLTRNKSKYLRLIDAGFKIINNEVTEWDGIDFYNRVHSTYHDKNTIEFI